MQTLEVHDWQKNLGQDVMHKVRHDLQTGVLPWISYDAEELGGRLVREYSNGKRVFVEYVNGHVVLKPAPRRD